MEVLRFATFTGKIHQLENEDSITEPTHGCFFTLPSFCKRKQKTEVVAAAFTDGHFYIMGYVDLRESGSNIGTRMISLVKLAYTSTAKTLVSWAHCRVKRCFAGPR